MSHRKRILSPNNKYSLNTMIAKNSFERRVWSKRHDTDGDIPSDPVSTRKENTFIVKAKQRKNGDASRTQIKRKDNETLSYLDEREKGGGVDNQVEIGCKQQDLSQVTALQCMGKYPTRWWSNKRLNTNLFQR